jgi:hypothetical protein
MCNSNSSYLKEICIFYNVCKIAYRCVVSSKMKVFGLERVGSYDEVVTFTKACEGRHMQQVSYSTYHQALTQVCFGCKVVRTNIKGI